jgi:hypothetical protein
MTIDTRVFRAATRVVVALLVATPATAQAWRTSAAAIAPTARVLLIGTRPKTKTTH